MTKKRGPGRPTDDPLVEQIEVRVTPAQKAKWKRLGGSAWTRRQINKTNEPKQSD